MVKFKLTLVFIVSALVFIFVVQNWEVVPLRFLFWSFEVPRLVLVMMLLIFGFLFGLVYATFSRSKEQQ